MADWSPKSAGRGIMGACVRISRALHIHNSDAWVVKQWRKVRACHRSPESAGTPAGFVVRECGVLRPLMMMIWWWPGATAGVQGWSASSDAEGILLSE